MLLAGGATASLDSLKVGDKVAAVDPETGVKSDRTVEKVWKNFDVNLMDVTVSSSGKTSVIHATANHPFWDQTRIAWVDARMLTAGDKLLSADGTTVTVASTKAIAGAGARWDLTVAQDHDFYVVTDTASVLVHNCPTIEEPEPVNKGALKKISDSQLQKYLKEYGTDAHEWKEEEFGLRAKSMPSWTRKLDRLSCSLRGRALRSRQGISRRGRGCFAQPLLSEPQQ